MEEKNKFDINFDEKYEEIISAMQKKQDEEYEDPYKKYRSSRGLE